MMMIRSNKPFRKIWSVNTSNRYLSVIPPYLHETKIPTYHFQDSLPKLEVPKLEDTLKQYVYFSEPMVSKNELEVSKKVAEEFGKGEGLKLQEELIALDKSKYSCFYNEMWFDMYLEARAPLPLNFNPQLTFNDDKISTKMEQATRTTDLLVSSLRFYKTLSDEKLKPDIFHTQPKKSETALYDNVCRMLPRTVSFYGSYLFGAYPLDMSQYNNLFSSTRLPKKGRDEVKKFTNPEQSKHVMIQRGNSFYSVQVLNDDMSILDRNSIERAIRAILQDDQQQQMNKHSVGILTSLERDEWANVRSALEGSSSKNKSSLESIDSALFAICLDDKSPTSVSDISAVMLTGEGTNRWFDKSFQLIVAENGKSSVNFEHSWGDGVAVLRYFNEVYEDSINAPASTPVKQDLPSIVDNDGTNNVQSGVPRRLNFDIDTSVQNTIEKAKKDFDHTINSLQLGTFETENFGSQFLREKKIGPDGFMQMGFQLAHQRMKGYTPATYESASTSAFKHGRTETIRSATPEAHSFAKAFCDDSISKDVRAGLMKKAIKNHGQITKKCLLGKGMDRHLFALKTLAARKGKTPALFEDKAYQVMSNIILSTSTLDSKALQLGGFGPVGPDCFALAYGITPTAARTSVATYGLGSQEFADHLDKAYKDMLSVL